MAGQVAYHLMEQARTTQAPWAVTTIVSCLPVLVLGMGTALAHMLHEDADAVGSPHSRSAGPSAPGLPGGITADRDGPDRDQTRTSAELHQTGRAGPTGVSRLPIGDRVELVMVPASGHVRYDSTGLAREVASSLVAAGKPVSRRALRNGGVRGSNEALNALSRDLKAELKEHIVVSTLRS
jgi:hypothetical protein